MAIATGEKATAADVNAALNRFFELAGGEAHAVTAASTWENYDISGIVPAGTRTVEVLIQSRDGGSVNVGARENGTALVRYFAIAGTDGTANITPPVAVITVNVDASRIIDIYDSSATKLSDFSIIGYWKGI